MQKKETHLEVFKNALTSTVKSISEKKIIAEYYQRCFGEDLPEAVINKQPNE